MFMVCCAGAIFESKSKIDGAQVVQSLELQIREKTGWSQPVYKALYLALQSPLLNKQVRALLLLCMNGYVDGFHSSATYIVLISCKPLANGCTLSQPQTLCQ